jgi:hypothetical protein
MNRVLDRWIQNAHASGLDIHQMRHALRGVPAYLRDLSRVRAEGRKAGWPFPLRGLRPCLADRHASAGLVSEHYFYQDWFVAQRVFARNPRRHVDVGSRIDGVVSSIAAFRDVEVFDIRPLALDVPAIRFRQVDLTRLPPDLEGYCDSVSSLHAIEHIGLGRYGDPVDYMGHLAGLDGIHRLLQPGGAFYLSVPIGEQRLEFNAHRVFALGPLVDLLARRYRVNSFSYVDDANRFHPEVGLAAGEVAANFGCDYGCGVFELTRL